METDQTTGQASEGDALPQPQAPKGPPEPQEAITEPAKLLRIATMVRELLEETRQATIDEPGRARLREIYLRSFDELREVLSPDLQQELA
ncbi:MAG TPA: proteasome activator, partial [Actinomycetota bacterium]